MNKHKFSIKDFKMVFVYLAILTFSVLFTCVYYRNSHGLRDLNMTLLFIPSLVSLILFLALALCQYKLPLLSSCFFNSGFALLWIFLCLSGVYNMAKVTNSWLIAFLILSIVCFIVSLIFLGIDLIKKDKKNHKML